MSTTTTTDLDTLAIKTVLARGLPSTAEQWRRDHHKALGHGFATTTSMAIAHTLLPQRYHRNGAAVFDFDAYALAGMAA
jgi:hypothetical protein